MTQSPSSRSLLVEPLSCTKDRVLSRTGLETVNNINSMAFSPHQGRPSDKRKHDDSDEEEEEEGEEEVRRI